LIPPAVVFQKFKGARDPFLPSGNGGPFSVKVLVYDRQESRAAEREPMRREMTEEERREHGRKIREGIQRAKERRQAEGRDSVRYNQRM
jgi:hypothetical protein